MEHRYGVRHPPQMRTKARQLRQSGLAVKKIASALGISVSTSSLWTRDVVLSPAKLRTLERNARRGWVIGSAVLREKKNIRVAGWTKEAAQLFDENKRDPLFMIGLGLYWGEGAKTAHCPSITSVDAGILRTWQRWFRRFVPLDLVGGFRLHIGNDAKRASKYWATSLGMKKVTTYRSWAKKNHRRVKWPNGVMRLSARGVGCAEWHFKILEWIRLATELFAPVAQR